MSTQRFVIKHVYHCTTCHCDFATKELRNEHVRMNDRIPLSETGDVYFIEGTDTKGQHRRGLFIYKDLKSTGKGLLIRGYMVSTSSHALKKSYSVTFNINRCLKEYRKAEFSFEYYMLSEVASYKREMENVIKLQKRLKK